MVGNHEENDETEVSFCNKKQLAYAGDVDSKQCYENLKKNENSHLIDVRSSAEWNFVGIPNLDAINKEVTCLSWRSYPNMQINEKFLADLEKIAKIDKANDVIYLICRAGGRSKEAAIAMTEAGYQNCFNVEDGFEGRLDENGHRNNKDGWKAAKLPWIQF